MLRYCYFSGQWCSPQYPYLLFLGGDVRRMFTILPFKMCRCMSLQMLGLCNSNIAFVFNVFQVKQGQSLLINPAFLIHCGGIYTIDIKCVVISSEEVEETFHYHPVQLHVIEIADSAFQYAGLSKNKKSCADEDVPVFKKCLQNKTINNRLTGWLTKQL